MTKHFCDRCGKECKTLSEIKVPKNKTLVGSIETYPVAVCYDCEKDYNNIIDKLIDIRFVLFRDFMKGGE